MHLIKTTFFMDVKSVFMDSLKTLNEFIAKEENFKNIEDASNIIVNSLISGGTVFSCGNGGSMCDAMHFAEELTGSFREKRKPVAALAISDSSHITCTANDFGFDFIFSRFIEAFGKENDVLLAISTSGNSTNIIEAAKKAKEKNIKVVALSGKDGGKLKDYCDIEVRAPYSKYSDRTQEIHIKVIHCLIELIEKHPNFSQI